MTGAKRRTTRILNDLSRFLNTFGRASRTGATTRGPQARLAGLRTLKARGTGDEVTRRIILGTFALSSGYYDAYYLKALKARRVIKNDFDRVFASADFVTGPTTPTPAFKLGEKTSDPLTMYLSDIFTVSANLAGLPAISIPYGMTTSRLPVGFQLHAKAFDDARLLRAAITIEKALAVP